MAKVSHLTSETVDSVADPDCREMTEKANHHSDKLAMEQDFRAAVSKAGLPSDGLSDDEFVFHSKVVYQILKAKKPKKAGEAFEVFGFHASTGLVCLRTYVMRAAPL